MTRDHMTRDHDATEITGIHHVTCISGDAQENLDFYVGVLGMRLVKRSVNQDDVSAYHLFYADAKGSPGTDLTFFDWPLRVRERRERQPFPEGRRAEIEAGLRPLDRRESEGCC